MYFRYLSMEECEDVGCKKKVYNDSKMETRQTLRNMKIPLSRSPDVSMKINMMEEPQPAACSLVGSEISLSPKGQGEESKKSCTNRSTSSSSSSSQCKQKSFDLNEKCVIDYSDTIFRNPDTSRFVNQKSGKEDSEDSQESNKSEKKLQHPVQTMHKPYVCPICQRVFTENYANERQQSAIMFPAEGVKDIYYNVYFQLLS
ncbi:uncharacterized protein LOC128635628 isoform X2 [Bombina bombina]|uniref:uncharacterized protein LOC128635628 isoform X2 n=1 Tax=Bombina bombina TaxID=8345 RepID=UPI00235A7633|nr:uncharacterized protein LOC128635628 isoform X2 [Bombina bombina]